MLSLLGIWRWDTSHQLNPSHTYSGNGTYEVKLKDGCGQDSLMKIVVIKSLRTPFDVISGDTSVCPGGTTVLDAGPGYYDYQWGSGEVTQTKVASAGVHTINVTLNNGCSYLDTITVTEGSASAALTITGTLQICAGATTTLDAGLGFSNYIWSNGDLVQTTTVAAGEYSVEADDSDGCKQRDTVTVVEQNNIQIDLGNDTTICASDSLLLDAGTGYASYIWSTGETTQTIYAKSGSYDVVVGANGCQAKDTLVVTIGGALSVAISGAADLCPNDSVQLTVPGTFDSLRWDNGITTSSYYAKTGEHIVTAYKDGCAGKIQ